MKAPAFRTEKAGLDICLSTERRRHRTRCTLVYIPAHRTDMPGMDLCLSMVHRIHTAGCALMFVPASFRTGQECKSV